MSLTYETLRSTPQPPIELYVFGDEHQARAVGFQGQHRDYPWMRAMHLTRGEDAFYSLRGMMISRIVITPSAHQEAYRYPVARVMLDRLRSEAPRLLRAEPAVFLEL